jgi:hypothetical protein
MVPWTENNQWCLYLITCSLSAQNQLRSLLIRFNLHLFTLHLSLNFQRLSEWKSMSLGDFNWRRIDLLLWQINWCVIAKVRKARPIKSMISLLSFGKHIGQIHHVNPKTLTMDNALGVCILTPSWCKLISWKEFVKDLASLCNHVKCVSFNQAKSFL